MRNTPFTVETASPLQKLLGFVVGTAVLVLGLMFSAVIIVAGVVIGLMVWGYLWWKTRELRRAMREAQTAGFPPPPSGGDIIEGEAVVVEEVRTSERVVETDDNTGR